MIHVSAYDTGQCTWDKLVYMYTGQCTIYVSALDTSQCMIHVSAYDTGNCTWDKLVYMIQISVHVTV